MKKWILVLSVIICLPFNAYSEIKKGYCGSYDEMTLTYAQNCEYTFDSEDGMLTISGTGSMGMWESDQVPWRSEIGSVVKIEILDGITGLSNFAFMGAINLKSVILPDSVSSFAYGTFSGAQNLETIALPNNAYFYGSNAFSDTNRLTSVFCAQHNEQNCIRALQVSGKTEEQIAKILKTYQKIGDNQYLYNGKFYSDTNNISSKDYDVKRIYTIDEANLVAKPTGNTVKIKYR